MKNEKQTPKHLTKDEWLSAMTGTVLYGGLGLCVGRHFHMYTTMFILGILAVWRALPALIDPFIKVNKDQNKG